MKKKKKNRALVMFSGGLDSILAVKILQEQGIEITGLVCVSYFFDDILAHKAAKKLGIELITIDFSDEHLSLVKNPKFGYGKGMNPCIDCHILMFKNAKGIKGFDFVATGEVLGERPMSQNKQTMKLIKKESGLDLLRPLSAKLLKSTLAEEKGFVHREKLLDISGRNRKRQIELAKKWGIKEYPAPAGGCLLTDPEFSKRFKKMLVFWPDCNGNDVKLLRYGRHFWKGENLIVVGRNEKDNAEIKNLSKKGDMVIEPKEFPGPTILIRSKKKILEESLVMVKELMLKYSKKRC
ncbi:tRNA 4-thiouridine(8) synthase ThiI [Patescibacteria group bacterium]